MRTSAGSLPASSSSQSATQVTPARQPASSIEPSLRSATTPERLASFASVPSSHAKSTPRKIIPQRLALTTPDDPPLLAHRCRRQVNEGRPRLTAAPQDPLSPTSALGGSDRQTETHLNKGLVPRTSSDAHLEPHKGDMADREEAWTVFVGEPSSSGSKIYLSASRPTRSAADDSVPLPRGKHPCQPHHGDDRARHGLAGRQRAVRPAGRHSPSRP